MKKDFFKPEDFIFGEDGSPFEGIAKLFGLKEQASDLANAKLNKLIESWPYAYGSHTSPSWYVEGETEIDKSKATRLARLAFIEEIKKECVKHEPEFKTFKFTTANNEVLAADFNFLKCKHCGVALQATWEIKEK